MSAKEIKKLLIDKDITQTELARRVGVSPAGLNQVINGKRKTRHIREAIARELGMEVSELFPETKAGIVFHLK
ncbi:MAG: helix-turn-helix transcriptional regulator [Deltaproteobacteria bacterium]|nr:MAG: helix-turn-helix transcriptional regulator [Deltaproteobacteria bacterium]